MWPNQPSYWEMPCLRTHPSGVLPQAVAMVEADRSACGQMARGVGRDAGGVGIRSWVDPQGVKGMNGSRRHRGYSRADFCVKSKNERNVKLIPFTTWREGGRRSDLE